MSQFEHAHTVPEVEAAGAESGQAVKLLGVTVDGDVRGALFEARVQQRFRNASDRNVEATYTFPLPFGAVLLGMDVTLGAKRLQGCIVEAGQAQAGYESAISEGNAAIVLERTPDGSYSASLGNLAAGEECCIALRYAQVLAFEQGGLRLMIPTVLAPRYGDAQKDGGLQPHQEPAHSLTAEYPFELALRLHGVLARARVSSPSHPISVERGEDGDALRIALARSAFLDRDFVLLVEGLEHGSMATVGQGIEGSTQAAALVSFCPRIGAERTPAENASPAALKILVDCSGSMAGDSIAAARRALQAITQQLPEGAAFSLSKFGNHAEHRSRGLWHANERTRLSAQRWIGELEADMGGTAMGEALPQVFALGGEQPADVLMLTDGDIYGIDSLLHAAQQSAQRLFIVGIGSSPAETNLRRLAEASGGACEFVAPGEAVQPAVQRMFARLRSPRLENLRLQWPENAAPEWEQSLPRAVFDGDTLHVFAFFAGIPQGEVQLFGKRPGAAAEERIASTSLPASAAGAENADAIARMAGAARCKHEPENVQLALHYQVLTPKTAFLLVHERKEDEKPQSMPQQQSVAHMLPAGWGGYGAASVDVPVMFRRAGQSDVKAVRNEAKRGRAFIRRDVERRQPPYWNEAEQGLTPLGVHEWLCAAPLSQWPSSYMELMQRDMGTVVGWLQSNMSHHGGKEYGEKTVVRTFLHVMAGSKTALKLKGCSSSFWECVWDSLRGVLAAWGTDAALAAAMEQALQGMDEQAWPPEVISVLEEE